MKIVFTLLSFLVCTSIFAQKDSIPPPPPPAIKIPAGQDTIKIEAKFPGGPDAWVQYLQKNLRAEIAAENIVLRRRQKDSVEQVIVSFLVDREGNIAEVKVENPQYVNPVVGAEAKRVIAKGPKWLPATINGQPVIYRQKQSISFAVSSR